MRALVFTIAVAALALRALLLSVAWGWFVPLVFPAAPLLSPGTALGLIVTATVAFTTFKRDEHTPEEIVDMLLYHMVGLTVSGVLMWVAYLIVR